MKVTKAMKEEFNKDMESLRKKHLNRNYGKQHFLKSNRKIQLKTTQAECNKWKTEFQAQR
jgi:hypothetical protein